MAEVFHDDVVEQILIRLDANNLNHYKSVCKSWQSLITSHRFINRHLHNSYNKDRYNNILGYRRVSKFRAPLVNYDLVGSSNGLVCIHIRNSYLIVGNPLTREVRQLSYPPYIGSLKCWGFGYDSSRDDYKVVVGAHKGIGQICFRLLSFKFNVWRDIVGEVNYLCFNNADGLLFNGALHWIKSDENYVKQSILSFDLSKEEFKETLVPDASYSKLGIVNERLCMFKEKCVDDGVWLMKTYNEKVLWEHVKILHDHEMKYDTVHFIRSGLFKDYDRSWIARPVEYRFWEFMDAHIYVESLVSPHEVAIESKVEQTVSVQDEKVDLGASNEQIQEVVAVLIKDVGEPQLEKHPKEHAHEVVEKHDSDFTYKEDLGNGKFVNNQNYGADVTVDSSSNNRLEGTWGSVSQVTGTLKVSVSILNLDIDNYIYEE